jgi:integrator complex subunit 3
MYISVFFRPTQELLKQLLTRQSTEGDMFVVAALKYWCREYEDKLGELLGTLLLSRYPIISPNKRKRSSIKHNQIPGLPSGEQVLGHLDQLRQYSITTSELQIYQSEGMQKALQQAQAASSDSLRKSYGDLFALAEINEENEPPSLSTSSTKKHAPLSIGLNSIKGHRKTTGNAREKSTFKRAPPRDRNTESSEQTSEVNISD